MAAGRAEVASATRLLHRIALILYLPLDHVPDYLTRKFAAAQVLALFCDSFLGAFTDTSIDLSSSLFFAGAAGVLFSALYARDGTRFATGPLGFDAGAALHALCQRFILLRLCILLPVPFLF
ncbi:hypothetical protein JCM1840_003417 [Sporobolomyces johnsonii]